LEYEHSKDTSSAEIEGLKKELQTYQEKLETLTDQHQKYNSFIFSIL
jgi:uncharacterized coiled-coil DUF342 family protein